MRLALFEKSGVPCSIAIDKVLHVLTEPHVFSLPLLKDVFAGGFIYQERVVPLLNAASPESVPLDTETQIPFVLVCEAEYGLLGVPADRIIRITRSGEGNPEGIAAGDSWSESYEINGCNYRQLDLNAVLDDPDFTMCGLKD